MKDTKAIKPLFIVDLTEAETPEEVLDNEETLVGSGRGGHTPCHEKLGSNITIEVIDEHITKMKPIAQFDNVSKEKVDKIFKILTKKEPWYKRFWKWITRKK